MPSESRGYYKNLVVTLWSPQDFQDNEAAERSLGTRMCNVTTALVTDSLFLVSIHSLKEKFGEEL